MQYISTSLTPAYQTQTQFIIAYSVIYSCNVVVADYAVHRRKCMMKQVHDDKCMSNAQQYAHDTTEKYNFIANDLLYTVCLSVGPFVRSACRNILLDTCSYSLK